MAERYWYKGKHGAYPRLMPLLTNEPLEIYCNRTALQLTERLRAVRLLRYAMDDLDLWELADLVPVPSDDDL